MRLTRFCSQAELDKFMRGVTMHNATDHYQGGQGGSTSIGFCFTTDEPMTAWRYLKGIVCPEVCMVLDIPASLLHKAYGAYCDYSDNTCIKRCIKPEYHLTKYSNRTAKLIRTIPLTELATPEEIEVAKVIYQLKTTKK